MFLSKLIILKANKLIILRKLIILLNSKFTSFLNTVIKGSVLVVTKVARGDPPLAT